MADCEGRLSLSGVNKERLRNGNLLFSRVNLDTLNTKADKTSP